MSTLYSKDSEMRHSFIIDIIRSLANAILQHKDSEEFGCICLEGSKNPDVMFVHQGHPIMIEVGKYEVSRWKHPVIHIGLDRTISTINWISTGFTKKVLRAVIVALSCVKTEDDLDYYMSQVC